MTYTEPTYPVPEPPPLPDPTTSDPHPFPTTNPPLVLARTHTRPARYDPDPTHEDPDTGAPMLKPEIITFEPPLTPVAIRFGPSPAAYPDQPSTDVLGHNGVWYRLTPEYLDPTGYDPDGERPYSQYDLMTLSEHDRTRDTHATQNSRNRAAFEATKRAHETPTPPPPPPPTNPNS